MRFDYICKHAIYDKESNCDFTRASHFWYISMLSLHEYHVKMPNSTFFGPQKQATTIFSLGFVFRRNSTPGEILKAPKGAAMKFIKIQTEETATKSKIKGHDGLLVKHKNNRLKI